MSLCLWFHNAFSFFMVGNEGGNKPVSPVATVQHHYQSTWDDKKPTKIVKTTYDDIGIYVDKATGRVPKALIVFIL